MEVGWPMFTYSVRCDLVCAPYHVGAGKAELNERDLDVSSAR